MLKSYFALWTSSCIALIAFSWDILMAKEINITHNLATITVQNKDATPRRPIPIVDRYWYRSDDLFSVADEERELIPGSFVILANDIDVTQLGTAQGNSQIVYSAKSIQLKQGLNTIEIYTGSPADGWTLYKSYQVGILDNYGFEKSQFKASLAIDSSTQPYFNSSGSALPPGDPKQFYDIDYKTGFNLEAERAGWSFSASQDWVGTSRETKALRFSELGSEAPLFDLSGYNFELKNLSTKIEVGNNSGIGSNPLLVERISNRGITITQGIGSALSVGLTAQSGRLITGYDDFLGVGQDFNSLYGAELTLHPFEEKEHLQIAISWLDSEQPAQADVGFGQVPVGEASQGWGLSLTSKTFNQRVVASLQFASSTYSAPDQQEVDEFRFQNIFLRF